MDLTRSKPIDGTLDCSKKRRLQDDDSADLPSKIARQTRDSSPTTTERKDSALDSITALELKISLLEQKESIFQDALNLLVKGAKREGLLEGKRMLSRENSYYKSFTEQEKRQLIQMNRDLELNKSTYNSVIKQEQQESLEMERVLAKENSAYDSIINQGTQQASLEMERALGRENLLDNWITEQRKLHTSLETKGTLAAPEKSSVSMSSPYHTSSKLGNFGAGNATVLNADPMTSQLPNNHGSHRFRSSARLSQRSKELCKKLQEHQRPLPKTDFFGPLFKEICNRAKNRNVARVIQTLTPHIVPSAEAYAMRCSSAHLVENWSENWNRACLVSQAENRPQPAYAVGFRWDAFTKEQHDKLKPWVGDAFVDQTSSFLPTCMMYFPFLTCEVRSGGGGNALDAADRQNSINMTIATRGVAQLFRRLNRQEELFGEILGFSVSHDEASVRLYAHYVEIIGDSVRYLRETIRAFGFTELEGRERDTSYRIITNIYETWVPMHLDRIRSAVDQLPSVFE